MTKESLIKQLETTCYGLDPIDPLRLLVDDVIEALRENAMREVQRLGQEIEQEPVMILPDGSAFGVMSFPLPDDHWLYAPNEYKDGEYEPIDLPKPILTHALSDAVVAAVRYAVRGATMRGQETDFDPDALVQNAVYALCGPYATQPQPEQEPVKYSDYEPDGVHHNKPQQEPVAYLVLFEGAGKLLEFKKGNYIHGAKVEHIPLYAKPQIEVGCAECGVNGGYALYCVACAENFVGGYKDSGVPAVETGLEQVSPDTPPQRTWVGLTDEEKSELWEISRAAWPRYITYASLAEAKLKERNT